MAEFVAFNPAVKAKGLNILGFITCMRRGQEHRRKILKKSGIDPQPDSWYPMQFWLNAFKGLSQEIGELNLFLMGKKIIDSAEFPPVKDLEQALDSINIAYHMNHQVDGETMFNSETGQMLDGIGYYKLISFNEVRRKAVMKCKNPYPSKFDEGLIAKIVEKFRPVDSNFYEVKIDITKERRSKGGDSCTYLINW
ncbi:MAG: hypothetical protein MK212_12080 [Saprospiraceae bacterium]|nr:hypothetical protein [Saprospiraceae bacterium]